jgi:hypothetical protein
MYKSEVQIMWNENNKSKLLSRRGKKGILNYRISCYCSFQHVLLPQLLRSNVQINSVLPVFIYESEAWVYALTENHKLGAFEWNVQRRRT